MPRRSVRSVLASLVIVGSVVPGVVTTSASAAEATPIVPTGGCWRYVPGPGEAIDDATGITDISTVLEAWGADPELTLSTAGDTAVGGVRTFALDVADGPAVQPQLAEVAGTATYFFDVIDPQAQRSALDPVVVDFEIEPGEAAIPAMQAEGSFPIEAAGTSALLLRSVYFDLPDLGQRLACNGQILGTPLVNPAKTPLDTTVLAPVTTVSATVLAVTSVLGQEVLTAARAGDSVDVTLTGFGSEQTGELGFCGPGAGEQASCGQVPVTTLADGSATATLVVPADAASGAGSIRARFGPDLVVDQPMRVLGTPVLTLAETSEQDRLSVQGAEWDPLRQVQVMAVDEAGEQVGGSVRSAASTDGLIEVQLSVPADAEVTAVVASQERPGTVLRASVEVAPRDVDGGGGGGGGDTDTDTGTDTGGTGGTTTTTPVAAAPAASPPLDIPAPIDLPVNSVTDPKLEAAGPDVLAVSKVTLVGSPGLADLFGGSPERTLRFQVENISKADVIAPGLSIAVGKGDDPDPVYTSDGFGRLAPGESLNLEIPIALSAGSFGEYTITGQIGTGESGAFTTTWETYPWGLLSLNALGILLVLFAVRRRLMAPTPSRVSALVAAPGAVGAGAGAGAAVIDLAVLERWWALQDGEEPMREPAGATLTADAVVDVEAVDRWLERCSARGSQMEHSVPRTSSAN